MSESENVEAGWPWSALGLEAPAQAPQIRKAYARALKAIDQQRDVAGFQALREARDEALASARDAVVQDADAPILAGRGRSLEGSPPRSEEPAEDGGGAIFVHLASFLEDPWARISLASWERLLEERPLMPPPQAYAYERRVALALDGWLDRELPPTQEVFLLLDRTFGWSMTTSHLGEFLPRMRERRLRTIIGSLRA
jgi:hypothetical protein